MDGGEAMKHTIARGIIREVANDVRAGIDLDTALRAMTAGASPEVREAVMQIIEAYHVRDKRASAETVKQAVIRAAEAL